MSQSSSQPVLDKSRHAYSSAPAESFSSAFLDQGASVREASANDLAELLVSDPSHHPLPTGFIFTSPGRHFTYRVIGPCCQLFDREELPWPCCRIQWHSKEPSWRRIGRRFVADIAAKRCPSYAVEILNQEYSQEPFVLTLYWLRFPSDIRDWWYSKIR